jgi:hypothetical protein
MKGAGYERPNASLPLRVSPSLPYRDAYSSFDYGNDLFLRHSRNGSSKRDFKMFRKNSHSSSCVTWPCDPYRSTANVATDLWDPTESQPFQSIESSISKTIHWHLQVLWTVKVEGQRQRRSVTEEARSAKEITYLANPFIVMKVP